MNVSRAPYSIQPAAPPRLPHKRRLMLTTLRTGKTQFHSPATTFSSPFATQQCPRRLHLLRMGWMTVMDAIAASGASAEVVRWPNHDTCPNGIRASFVLHTAVQCLETDHPIILPLTTATYAS